MKKKPSNNPLSKATPDALEPQALAHFLAGRYKEASDLYKSLLKSNNNVQWRQALAQCYLLRAQAMADKGMLKEAVVLWENYADHATAPLQSQEHYLAWLLATQNTAKIKARLSRLSAADLDSAYPEFAALLGLLIITAHPEFQALLPQDSAFITHLDYVREALAAYRNQQTDAVETALKKLPFRSAFRDFRALLKALVLMPTAPEQAQGLLLKIPADSPYLSAAQALLTYMSDGGAFVPLILRHNATQRRIIIQAKGFSKKHQELLDILYKQQNRLTDKLKFNLACQYQALFGSEAARQFCYASLAIYPEGLKDYAKQFGAIDRFDENRLQALQAEKAGEIYDAGYHWQRCLDFLKAHEPASADKIVFIQRYLAKKMGGEEGAALLADSLEADPCDRESYLQLLRYFDQDAPDPDEYKQWLDKALKQFPQDVDFLTLAIKAAAHNKAFKKSAQYAQALLKIDPVNTAAKQFLFNNHLSHARRLLKSKKFHLVDKEIHAAEQLNIGKRLYAQALLLRGFFQFLSEDKKLGLATISLAMQKPSVDPANAHFQTTLEALLLDLTPTSFLKSLPPIKSHVLSASELAQLAVLIGHYNGQGIKPKTLHAALEKIAAPLKSSLQKQDYSEEILLALCQALDAAQAFKLLGHCAKLLQAKTPQPIWVYYQLYAEADGEPNKLKSAGVGRLQSSSEQADAADDQRTAVLIKRFLERYYEAQNPFLGDDDFFDGFDRDEDIVEELFGHLPEAVVQKISAHIESVGNKISPDRVLKEALKSLPKSKSTDPRVLMSLMMEPELFMALLMLKAAQDLGIDTDVTIEDILDYIDLDDDGPIPSRFPFI